MTDQPLPDELISAVLDGEATPEEVAAVQASASGRARRDELAAVRALVGQPVVPPEGARDAAVAAALATLDEPPSRQAPAEGPGRRRRPLLPLLGAAASVVLVLALGLAVLRSSGRTQTEMATGAAVDQAAEVTTGSPGGTADGDPPAASGAAEADAQARTGGAGSGGPDLGPIADAAALHRLVADTLARPRPELVLPAAPTAAAPAQSAAASCPDEVREDRPDLGLLVLVASAHYEGAPVTVLAFRTDAAAPVRSFVVEPATCRVLLVDPS